MAARASGCPPAAPLIQRVPPLWDPPRVALHVAGNPLARRQSSESPLSPLRMASAFCAVDIPPVRRMAVGVHRSGSAGGGVCLTSRMPTSKSADSRAARQDRPVPSNYSVRSVLQGKSASALRPLLARLRLRAGAAPFRQEAAPCPGSPVEPPSASSGLSSFVLSAGRELGIRRLITLRSAFEKMWQLLFLSRGRRRGQGPGARGAAEPLVASSWQRAEACTRGQPLPRTIDWSCND